MFKRFFYRHDIFLTGLLVSLLLIGLFTLFSTTRGTGAENEAYFTKQLFFVLIGLVFYFGVSFIRLNLLKYKWTHIVMYVGLLVLLVAVLLFTAKIKGASRWFVVPVPVIGSVNIQPADIAKLVVILNGAFILTQWKNLVRNVFHKNSLFQKPFIPYVLAVLPLIALILIQPALGTTIIVSLTILFMYYFAAPSKTTVISYFYIIFSTIFVWFFFQKQDMVFKIFIDFIAILIPFLFVFKKSSKLFILAIFVISNVAMLFVTSPNGINALGEYQKDRVDCWLTPEIDPTGKCFQQIQARIAIGSGELFGRGFSQGLQVQRDRLPEFQNDFIYAAFAEQYGFVGTVVLLSIFFLFIMEIIRLSTKQKSEFSRIVILGIAIMFLFQVFINITMNNGLLPTTGISLPFLSYGGSFMWIALIGVGIVQNLSHNEILSEVETRKYERWDEAGDYDD